MPADCFFRLVLPVPLRIVTLYSLAGFLLRKFVSYRAIATKSQSIIISIKTVGHCENRSDLPSISRCKTDRSEVVVSAELSWQTALSF